MELDFLDDAAPELTSWITDRGNYLFEEQPRAVHAAALELHAAEVDETADWAEPEQPWE